MPVLPADCPLPALAVRRSPGAAPPTPRASRSSSRARAGMGFAGAYTAQAADPSAIFHNAAGIALPEGTQLYLGGTLIQPCADFTGASPFPGASITEKGDVGLLIPPHAYYTQQFNERLVVRRRPARAVRAGDRAGRTRTPTAGRFISQQRGAQGLRAQPDGGATSWRTGWRWASASTCASRRSALERRVPVVNPFTQQVVDGAAVTLESEHEHRLRVQPGRPGQAHRVADVGALLPPQGEGRLQRHRHLRADPDRQRASSTCACARRCRRAPCRSTTVDRVPRACVRSAFANDVRRLDVRGGRQLVPVVAPSTRLRLDVRDGAATSTRRSKRSTRTPSSTASAWSASSPTPGRCAAATSTTRRPAPPESISPLLPDANRHGFCLGGSWTSRPAAPRRGRLVRAAPASARPRAEPRRLRRHLQEQCAHAGRLARLHVLGGGATDAKPLCPRRRPARLVRGTARRPDGARP